MIIRHKDNIEKVKQLLKKEEQKIIIVTHYNPDGDAIGSMLGLYLFLRQNGYEVTAISPDDFPHFLHWMDGIDELLIHYNKTKKVKQVVADADIIFMLDFNHPERLNKLSNSILKSSATKILIDHHPHPHNFADIVISDTSVSSTAELIYELITGLKNIETIETNVAECLYCGIMTDTGCFSFNSSQPRTYRIISNLLKSGINKDAIFSKVYENYSINRMSLMGYCLNEKMVVKEEFHTAFITLTKAELEKFKHQPGDTEGFVNLPFSIKNIVFSILLIEKNDHIKLSFRSKNTFPANVFSEKHFNGGGHQNAAGGKSFAGMAETIEKLLNLLPQYKNELDNALFS